MKNVYRALGTLGLAGLAIYLLRDRLLPPPVIEPAPAPIRGMPSRPAPTGQTSGQPSGQTPGQTSGNSGDDLTAVAGIGPVYAARLQENGISSFDQLAAADPERIATIVGVRPKAVTDWITQAVQLRGSAEGRTLGGWDGGPQPHRDEA